MKKTILILLLFAVYFSTVGQVKKDTIKTKSINYFIDFSGHNLGSLIGDFSFTWQLDLSFGLNHKRHTLLAGVTGGPGLILYNHYSRSTWDKVDYLYWDQDYTRWGVNGGLLNYQFQFNDIKRKSKNSVVFYSSFSQYRYIKHIWINSNTTRLDILEKRIIQALIGYSYTKKLNHSFFIGTQFLTGLFYNIDFKPTTITNSNDVIQTKFYKLFPIIVIKPNISYKF